MNSSSESSSGSSSIDNPAVVNILFSAAYSTVEKGSEVSVRDHGGSRLGRLANRYLRMEEGHARLMRDYLNYAADRWDEASYIDRPKFTDVEFRRKFRMARGLYDVICEGILKMDSYFEKKHEVKGKLR